MTPRKGHLREVSPDERPAKPPLSLSEAVESGVYVEILKAQRRDIVRSLPDEKGPAKAALHRQLALISKEIETLELAATGDGSVVAMTDDEPFDSSAI